MVLPERESRDEGGDAVSKGAGLGVGVWDLDVRTQKVWLSAEFCEIHNLEGAAASTATVEALYAAVHPDDRRSVMAATGATLAERRERHEQSLRVVRLDGEVRPVLRRTRLVLGEGARPVRLSGVDIDLSGEARRYQPPDDLAQLRASEKRLRSLFAAIDQGYCLCEMIVDPAGRPVDYRFLEVNPLFETMTGLAGATGRTALELVPDLERHWVEVLAKVAFGGEPLRFERESRVMGRWFDLFSMPVEPRGRFAVVFKDITERKKAEAALLESEARLRRVLDNIVAFVGTLTTDGVLTDVNNLALEAADLDRTQVIGKPFWNCYWWSYSEAAQEQLRTSIRRAAAGQTLRYDAAIQIAGGAFMTIDFQLAPNFDEAGNIIELIPSAVDITKRKRAEAALVESEARLRRAAEAGRLATFEVEDPLVGTEARVSSGFRELYGLPTNARCDLATIAARIHPADRAAFVDEQRRLTAEGGPFSAEFRVVLPDGTVRWLHSRGEAEPGPNGAARSIRGVNLDITERKKAEERRMLLMREVDHRAKNALAVVQSVVRLTRADNPADFVAVVEGRIGAIAHAHTLLAESGWKSASLGRLLRRELAAHDSTRVQMSGEEVVLSPQAAQPFALAIHELVTNAAKYGALSSVTGRIEVSWLVEPGLGVRLVWREAGGPPVHPPTRHSFGSTLITRALEHQLGGMVRQDWNPEGLVCEVVIPSTRLSRPAAAPVAAEALS